MLKNKIFFITSKNLLSKLKIKWLEHTIGKGLNAYLDISKKLQRSIKTPVSKAIFGEILLAIVLIKTPKIMTFKNY
jgi:hypothetical protein